VSLSVEALGARAKELNLSDWAGALFFVTSAAILFTRAKEFSILLLPIVAHEVLIAASFLIWRTAPKRQSVRWYARVAAYGASFAFPILVTFTQMWRPHWVVLTTDTHIRTVGALLWLYGSLFGLWALWFLRRSFSIEPEARELRTEGPYRLARHPIYASHILQYTGFLLFRLTVPFALIYLFWFGLMFIRVRFEEGVLQAAFPAYEGYREEVGMFGPRLFRRASKRQILDLRGEARPVFADAPPQQSYPYAVAIAAGQTVGSSHLSGRIVTPIAQQSTYTPMN